MQPLPRRHAWLAVHRPTHAPATTLKTNSNSAPPKNKKQPLVLPLPPACVAGRSTGQQCPCQPSKQTTTAPRPLCVVSVSFPSSLGMRPAKLRLHSPPATVKTNGKSTPQKNKKSKPLVQPLLRRHAWLAGPPANTCPCNSPQNKQQKRPALSVSFPSSEGVKQSPKPKPPRAVSPETARRPRMTNSTCPNSSTSPQSMP